MYTHTSCTILPSHPHTIIPHTITPSHHYTLTPSHSHNSLGGENLGVAQGKYAVLWFKGKELNMVFGLLLSISNVVRHTPLPSPLTPHSSPFTLTPHSSPSTLTPHPLSSPFTLTPDPHPNSCTHTQPFSPFSPHSLYLHLLTLPPFPYLHTPHASTLHTLHIPLYTHLHPPHTSTLHTSSPYTHLDHTGWHNQHEH